jgi:hypothetical protein
MGAGVFVLQLIMKPKSGYSQMAELFLCISAGLVIYIFGLYAMRVPEIHNLSSLLPRRSTDVDTAL